MIIRDFSEQDNIKIFDRDIEESHADYNAQGLDSLTPKKKNIFGLSLEKNSS